MNMGVSPDEGIYNYGKGFVYVVRSDPKEFVLNTGSDKKLLDIVSDMYENKSKAGKLEFKNSFYLQRGAYDLVAVLDESVNDKSYVIDGVLIDLFDPKLPIYTHKEIQPGEHAFFFNISRVKDKHKPQVLASASRIYEEEVRKDSYSFVAKSPINTTNISRVLLPRIPRSVLVNGTNVFETRYWDSQTKTYLLEFENNPEGVSVLIKW